MAAKRKPTKAKDAKPRKQSGSKRSRSKGSGSKSVEQRAAAAAQTVPKGPRLSAFDAVMQATYIGIRRSQGVTWKQISGEVGLSVRQCHTRLEAQREADLSHSLRRDPVELIDWLLGEHERDLTAFTLVALTADGDNGRVGALNGREKTLERITALLQQTSRLPRNLGVMRHLHDLRVVSREIITLVVGIEQGKIDRSAAERYLAQITGGEKPPPVAQDQVDEMARRLTAGPKR